MRWTMGRRSENVEDRRGLGVPLAAGGGIGSIVLLLLALFFGFDPSVILQTDATDVGHHTHDFHYIPRRDRSLRN